MTNSAEVVEAMTEITLDLKQTMGEILMLLEKELGVKNEQIFRLEQALYAQQQLTLQANERIRKLENRLLNKQKMKPTREAKKKSE